MNSPYVGHGVREATPVAVVDPRYVYEDLLAMPEDGKRRELLEGDFGAVLKVEEILA